MTQVSVTHSITLWILLNLLLDITLCTNVRKQGILFQTQWDSPADANAIIWSNRTESEVETQVPAHILGIFIYQEGTFLVIERLVALEPELKKNDPFHPFGFLIASSLFRDSCHPIEVIPLKDLVTLFAKTTYYDDVLCMNVIHVLPILKVRHWHFLASCCIIHRWYTQELHIQANSGDSGDIGPDNLDIDEEVMDWE